MSVYFLTGKLGSGKNLVAVSRIRDYLERGRPVATNINLDLRKLVPKVDRPMVYRLPDYPTEGDLHAIGQVVNDDDEEQNGLVVLDEGAVIFNARTWSDKARSGVIDWMLHSRKLGWDVIIITQALSAVDKQLRETMAEYVVYMRRWDRVAVPLVGKLGRLLTLGFWSGRFPRLHTANVLYGHGPDAMHADTWHVRGETLFGAYPTKQRFSRSYEHGTFCMLPGASLVPAKAAAGVGVAAGAAGAAPTPSRRPKLRVVEAIARCLPPDERVRHVQRLDRRGLLRPIF